jgi:hypothetical protein
VVGNEALRKHSDLKRDDVDKLKILINRVFE